MALTKFLFLASLPFALTVQLGSNYPPCAETCLLAEGVPGCGNLDILCFCSSLAYLQGMVSCLKKLCNPVDYKNSTAVLVSSCQGYGVAVNITAIVDSLNAPTHTSAPASSSFSTTVPQFVTTTTTRPPQVATFTGGVLLQGSCASAQVTSIFAAGAFTQYLQVGCAADNLGCCPTNTTALAKCPADYTTTSSACCPSGWSIYSLALGTGIPCFRPATTTLTHPTTTSDSGAAPTPTVIITDKLFTQRFPLSASERRGLSQGAKAGIGVGVSIGGLLLLGLAWVGYKKYSRGPTQQQQEQQQQQQSERLSEELPPPPPPPYPEMSADTEVREVEAPKGPGRRAELDGMGPTGREREFRIEA